MQSIDTVVESLDQIIKSSIETSSPLGYFPALYRRVTLEVKKAIDDSRFEDGERMTQLVIIFAGRYIDSYENFARTNTCTHSWFAAFENGKNTSLTVLQHLLLGMNAHISLDLGIAASEVAKESPLAIKNDFILINKILGDQINDTQNRLTRIFGPLGFIDKLLGSIDEQFSLFSINYARDKAWSQMLELALANKSKKQQIIEERDLTVAKFSCFLVLPPKRFIRIILWIVKRLERGNVADKILILAKTN